MYRFIKRGLVSKNSFESLQRNFPNGKLWKNGVRCVTQTTKSDALFPERVDFPSRHIGPRDQDIVTMLDSLGYKVIIMYHYLFVR